MNPDVDFYFKKAGKWQQKISRLRTIVLEFPLVEELKWGVPCYSFQGANVVLIHVFKEYCALLFFKGALLKDADAILIQQTKNVQAARQLRFAATDDIGEMQSLVKAYVDEAIEIEKAGLKIELKPTAEFAFPEEFQEKLNENPALKTAFEALTPGRQRAYLLYFSAPKQSRTRISRIEKYVPHVLDGKGLKD